VRRAVDFFLLGTLFTITFTKLRWGVGPADVRIAELFAVGFVVAFVVMRVLAGDWRFPRTVQVLAAFFLLFLLVYLIGYFNLSTAESTTILELALIDPEIVSGGDLQYIHGVTLARLNGSAQLVQVDPHYTVHRAARGRAHVSRFEPAAWNAAPIRLTTPISASAATCDTDLPRIRFVMDPETPVVRGTRKVR